MIVEPAKTHCLPDRFAIHNHRKQCRPYSSSQLRDGKQWRTECKPIGS
ncbi:MAG: hypothetical protein GX621_16990 [Pirellulaceae bacterium]|nr:hypothetical protein [Pirellulaceae bacterium]